MATWEFRLAEALWPYLPSSTRLKTGRKKREEIKSFNKETISEVIEGYKPFGLTGINAIENSKYYSELIVKEVLTNK